MPTVLIVDDDLGMSSLLAKLLKLSGFSAETAPSGQAALAYLAKRKPDAVILDIMMPGMNGFEVLRRMRSEQILRDETPVIMFSAVSDRAYELEARTLGAVDYWVKGSLDFEHLASQLGHYISRSRPPETGTRGGGVFAL
jgi:DNA-binding response OmpR family regulator